MFSINEGMRSPNLLLAAGLIAAGKLAHRLVRHYSSGMLDKIGDNKKTLLAVSPFFVMSYVAWKEMDLGQLSPMTAGLWAGSVAVAVVYSTISVVAQYELEMRSQQALRGGREASDEVRRLSVLALQSLETAPAA